MKTIEEPATVPVGGSSVGGLPEWRLRRVTQYIGQNLQGRLRLEELSAVVHMSPYHFAHLFKRRTGVSPHRFARQQRIERARALLVTPAMPVSAVARSVGIRSASHFSTTFRRITGFTPSSYRRSRQAQPPGLTDGPDPDGRGRTSESRIPRDVD